MAIPPERTTKSIPPRDLRELLNCHLIVISGADKGREIGLDRDVVVVGNLESCDLVLHDDFVSRKHCEVRCKKDGHHLIDLQSRNGTFVGGVQVREAYLTPGVMLRIGQTDLLYQPQVDENTIPLSDDNHFGLLLGFSRSMRQLYTLLHSVAPSNITVLIEGETGTGKELVARSLHAQGKRAAQPFTVVDCGAVASNLIEADLFGHEKGAFTGAEQQRIGAFEAAHGGTVFLDEIGELPLALQPKLLRVLEQREIRRVGGEQTFPVDVRVVAATNRNLEEEVKAGRFREDLYYRLAVLKVKLPPLRERREDIPLIVEHLLSSHTDGRIEGLLPDAMARLTSHEWPGNVRELKNVLEGAMSLAEGPFLKAQDFNLPDARPRSSVASKPPNEARSMNEVEKQAIIATLEAVHWNKTAAAKRLGIAYSTLYEKVKKYGIKR